MSSLTWEELRGLDERARLLAHELWLHAGDGPHGVWLDVAQLQRQILGPWNTDEVWQGLASLGVQRSGNVAWWPRRMVSALLQDKPDAQRMRQWMRALQDVPAREQVCAALAQALQALPGCKGLLKIMRADTTEGASAQDDTVAQVLQMYHEILPDLPRMLKLTDARRSLIVQRLRELGQGEQALQAMRAFFERVAASDFLCGRGPHGWCADLEWLMRPSNFVKVLEGRYDGTCKSLPAYSEAFKRFMREYPNPVDVARAWSVWRTLRLDDRVDDVLACLQDDKMRYGKRAMPAAWRYLQDQPWLLNVDDYSAGVQCEF